MLIGELCGNGVVELQTGPFGSQLHSYDYVADGIPVVPTEAIKERRIASQDLPKVTEETASRLSKHKLVLNDILFARRGAQATGQTAIVRSADVGAICGTGAIRLRVSQKQSKVSPSFLSHFLSSPEAIAWIRAQAIGATMPNLNEGIIKRLAVPVPGIEQQEQIAAILDDLDDKIELNRRMNETLEAMAQAIFRDWFVDFGPTRRKLEGATDPVEIMGGVVKDAERARELADLFPDSFGDNGLPTGWSFTKLGDAFIVKIGRTPPRKEKQHFGGSLSDVPWISIRDLGICGTFISESSESLTEEAAAHFRVPLIEPDTVVVSFKLTVGRVAIADRPMISNEAIAQLAKGTKKRSPWFAYLWMKSYDYSQLGSTSSIANAVNSKSIKSINFYDMPNTVEAGFDKLVSPLFELIRVRLKEIRTLAATRDLLLPKLMSGEIRLGDSEELDLSPAVSRAS